MREISNPHLYPPLLRFQLSGDMDYLYFLDKKHKLYCSSELCFTPNVNLLDEQAGFTVLNLKDNNNKLFVLCDTCYKLYTV